MDVKCSDACKAAEYLGGSCQISLFECQSRMMPRISYDGMLCVDRRFHSCCCRTNRSIDRDTYTGNVQETSGGMGDG
jgi:hypothetical protein